MRSGMYRSMSGCFSSSFTRTSRTPGRSFSASPRRAPEYAKKNFLSLRLDRVLESGEFDYLALMVCACVISQQISLHQRGGNRGGSVIARSAGEFGVWWTSRLSRLTCLCRLLHYCTGYCSCSQDSDSTIAKFDRNITNMISPQRQYHIDFGGEVGSS